MYVIIETTVMAVFRNVCAFLTALLIAYSAHSEASLCYKLTEQIDKWCFFMCNIIKHMLQQNKSQHLLRIKLPLQ